MALLCAMANCLKAQNIFPSSGNVGIGTTSPQRTLDLSNSGQLTFGDDVVTNSANGLYWHSGTAYGIYRTSGAWTGGGYQQLRLQFDTGIQLGAGPGVNTGYDKSYVEIVNGKGLMVSSGNVGIGTTSPGATLDIQRIGSTPVLKLYSDRRSDSQVIGNSILFGGWNNQGWSTPNGAGIDFYVNYPTEGPGSNAQLRFWAWPLTTGGSPAMTVNGSDVGIGTTMPDAKLAVNGTIHSKKVIVDLNGWSDYVFKKDYKLMPLAQVKSYIDQNQHLPDMPAASVVEKDGINLGEMNKLLTKKVEELTLYLIEMKKDNELLNQRISKLENKN